MEHQVKKVKNVQNINFEFSTGSMNSVEDISTGVMHPVDAVVQYLGVEINTMVKYPYGAISTYLNTHKFKPHSMGNYALYGLNTFGCESIIDFYNDIWKFYAFEVGNNNAIYINKSGHSFLLNTFSNHSQLNITRLEEVKEEVVEV
jgi:hypothetical protein